MELYRGPGRPAWLALRVDAEGPARPEEAAQVPEQHAAKHLGVAARGQPSGHGGQEAVHAVRVKVVAPGAPPAPWRHITNKVAVIAICVAAARSFHTCVRAPPHARAARENALTPQPGGVEGRRREA